jgi:UDP-N-acetylglucosamine diphosphorylase / glucose-1-phosphate thymidylyltransferase / UDP-N-acetylgalactosamine diphosphorylase / glucosamine-1-phosphate N-acetyltransferase / galactosamine-1-phosphate N-acetyltransferase
MNDLDLILFDDAVARQWEPFALTRPVGELLFGTLTFRDRAERWSGGRCIGHIAADHLAGFEEPGAPPVVRLDTLDTGRPRLLLLSRFLPEAGASLGNPPTGAGPITAGGGQIVGWYLPAGAPSPGMDQLLDLADESRPALRVGGEVIPHVWNLVTRNPDQIARDLEALRPQGSAEPPAGSYRIGGHALVLDRTAIVEPGVVFDTSGGPIWLAPESRVRAFTRLAGPAFIGPGSIVLGGPLEAVSVGPVCRVRGELAESVCLGYVNKQHDGHMGHAYLGRWVNLGAETTNSDLKNNYGTIKLWTPSGEANSGEIKMGSLIGDHVKTGIGLLLNTGTVIGAGSNLYGSAMPPTFVPPFSWGTGSELVEFRVEKFLEVAERAMSRRGVTLSNAARSQLRMAWDRGRSMAEAGQSRA